MLRLRRLDTGIIGRETAKRVVVAAGSLGRPNPSVRCRDEHRSLPAPRPRSGAAGAPMATRTPALYFDRDVAPTRGPTITTAIDYLDGSDGHRYFVEDGGFDVIGNALWRPWRAGCRSAGVRRLRSTPPRGRDPLSVVMPWFGQAADLATAPAVVGASWAATDDADYDVTRSRPVVQAMIERCRQPCDRRHPAPAVVDRVPLPVTPHPLGGCNMGTSAADGGRPQGRGFGSGHVLDGSIVARRPQPVAHDRRAGRTRER